MSFQAIGTGLPFPSPSISRCFSIHYSSPAILFHLSIFHDGGICTPPPTFLLYQGLGPAQLLIYLYTCHNLKGDLICLCLFHYHCRTGVRVLSGPEVQYMDATETVIMETAEDLTHCSICNEFFSEPRMLPCIHNFCLRCLQQTASSMKMGPGDTMACHCCGKEFTIPPGGVTGLQRSLFIENLVKEMKLTEDRGTQCKAYLARGKEKVICVNQATTYCIECRQKFCKTCSEHHRRQKVSKKHHITMLELNHNQQVSSANYCSLHSHHQLSVYCFECKLIICDECCKQTHSIHTCKPIGEVIENSKMQITADLEVLASLSKAGSAKKEQLDTVKTECLKGFVDVEAEIIERGRKLKELVDAHVGCLLPQLVLMKTKRMFEIDSRIREIKTCLELTETFEKSCADMLLKTSSLQTCSEATALNKKAIQIQKLYDAC